MMTIEELLDMATHNLSMIEGAIGGETVMRYAAIAQAAAQTAQAMILYTATSKGTDNDTPVFWFRVDSGN